MYFLSPFPFRSEDRNGREREWRGKIGDNHRGHPRGRMGSLLYESIKHSVGASGVLIGYIPSCYMIRSRSNVTIPFLEILPIMFHG